MGASHALVALAFAALALVTAADAEWSELILGVSSDSGSGALEWLVAFVASMIALGFALGARAAWQGLPGKDEIAESSRR